MNNATKAFFKSGHGIVLAVYDTRRGQQEGREAEKILAFYPSSAAPTTQSSIVGLAQALTMFAGTFNKECPFHSMEAHNHLWTMYHAEPDLWLLLVVGRGLVGPHCLASSLTGFPKGLHSVMALLYGLLSTQLQQDPAAVSVQQRLQPLLQEAASSLLSADAGGIAALSCPLGLTGGVPLLPTSPAAFTRLQSLANSLLVSRLFGTRPVLGVVVCWQTCLLWSSVASSDTAALHSLAVRGLEPAVREGPKHKTVWRPTAAAHGQPPQLHSQPAASSSSSSKPDSDAICLVNPACWYCRPDGLVLPVGPTPSSNISNSSSSSTTERSSSTTLPVSTLLPRTFTTDSIPGVKPQQSVGPSNPADSSSGGTGLTAGQLAAMQQQGSSSSSIDLPVVYLQSGAEKARLMCWHHGPLLLLLLLEPSGAVVSNPAAVVSSFMELVARPGALLAAQLTAELPAKHLWHVQGLRYLYQDHLSAAVRASALRKVATLSQPSVHLTADTRRWAAAEAAAAADPTAASLGQGLTTTADANPARQTQPTSFSMDGSSSAWSSRAGGTALSEQWETFAAGGSDAGVEVVVKGANDCWVVSRHSAAGRQLTAVAEGDKDKGMLGVMRRVQGFCDSEVPGVFEGLA